MVARAEASYHWAVVRLRWNHPTVVSEGSSEDPVLRQYRYVLTTGSVDALVGAHKEALQRISGVDRRAVLQAVRETFNTGHHLSADDVSGLAHLVTVGAHRSPGAWTTGLPATVARRLAGSALVAESSFGLLGGYASWDGLSPGEPEGASPNDGFSPKRNRQLPDGGGTWDVPGHGPPP